MNRLIDVQLAASAWGVRKVLEACGSLSAEQFERPQGIGPEGGSLQSTLAHVVGAMFYFADNFAGLPFRERPELERDGKTPRGLIELLSKADAELRASISGALPQAGDDYSGVVIWAYSKRRVPFAAALAQVFDHNTHHRVQCVHMLKKLGVDPLPEAYPLAWASAQAADQRG